MTLWGPDGGAESEAAEAEAAEAEGGGDPPRLPVGEYWIRRRHNIGGAALCLVVALGMVVFGVLESDPASAAEFWRVVGVFLFGSGPILVIAGVALGWLRGGPLLEVTEEGLYIQKGGLWTIWPLRRVPNPEFLAWSEIAEIERMPRTNRAVVIRVRGRRDRWWEKLWPLGMPKGIRLGLTLVEGDPVALTRDLVGWSEHRLALEVQAGLAELPREDPVAEFPPGEAATDETSEPEQGLV
jgi:hypothetical protein